jgi:type II secretory pathway component GspD/PulD (secretin)
VTSAPALPRRRNKLRAAAARVARRQHTNILQTPSIITLDNEEAEIKVAQEVPFSPLVHQHGRR